MTWITVNPVFLAMLAMAVFGPPLAFVLGRWSSTSEETFYIDHMDGTRTKYRRPK